MNGPAQSSVASFERGEQGPMQASLFGFELDARVERDAGSESALGAEVEVNRIDVRKVDHLKTAHRLARTMRGPRRRSPQQLETGRAICRHLLAVLDEQASADVQR